MTSVASLIKFKELCECFENLSKSKRPEKLKLLQEFMTNYKMKASEMKSKNDNVDTSFYPAMRLLLPNLERKRGPYGIKETKFARKIINMMCLPPNGSEAMQLSKFRSSSSNAVDFAEAAYWVLRKRPFTSKNLSILDVNNYLNNIAKKNSENDTDGLETELFNLFKSCCPEEQKWIIRIILKDLKLGLGQESILNAYHPDASNIFSNNTDLENICETLSNTKKPPNEINISLFTPFRPMLLKHCNALQFAKHVGDEMYYLESKFDGERSQMHMQNGKFKYFTRNGFDFTASFGDSYDNGIFTPLLKNAFNKNVKSFILDGEMMGWNKLTNSFGSKGMNFDVKHLNVNTTYQPCFCAFDILVLNDEVLTNKPLHERLSILHKNITPIHGTIMLSKLMEAHCKQDILDALNLSMDNEEEGIVFKHPNSIYKPNNRNAGWWKMKLEYFEDVMSDLDVIIMGGYYGEGRNHNKISAFLVGVAINNSQSLQRPKQFMSLARIKTGLSDDELESLNKKLNKHWIKSNHENAISYGFLFGKDIPDVWIKPENSCILQVRASELVRTVKADYKTNYTLRFPRILKVREDKLYYECLTTDELDELTMGEKYVQKLSKRHLYIEDIEHFNIVKKKKTRKYVVEEFAPIEQQTTLLEGYQFCVLSGTDEWKKEDIENMIRENGGTVVRTEGAETTCILVGKNHPRVELLKTYNKQYDLVKVDWLKRIFTDGVFTTYKPNDTLFMCRKTCILYQALYDKYGDSYTNLLTRDALQSIFIDIEKSGDFITPLPVEVDTLHIENDFTFFKKYHAYFDKYKIIGLDSSSVIYESFMDELEFKFFGGSISSNISDNVNLIIINSRNPNRMLEVDASIKANFGRNIDVVTNSFIYNEVKKRKLSSY